MENKGYEFKEEGHSHLFDGKRLTGITTILSVISKGDGLVQWASNMAVRYVGGEWKPDIKYSQEAIDIILNLAKFAHRAKKEEAGQKGTDIHTIIEKYITEAIESEKDSGYIPILGDEEKNEQVRHFVKWAIANKVKFLESEKHIYSEILFLGGICDIICEIDGDVWLVDIKTGSGIYAEAFWQMGGYEILIEEMKLYPKIKGYIVLNLRKNGEFEEKRSISNEENKKAFLACLDIYRIKQKVEGNLL